MEPVVIAPVFVIEGRDIGIYGSVEDAQVHLEPPDVAGSVDVGYDAHGRRLEIATDGRNTFISLAEFEPSSVEDLEARLRDFLGYLGHDRATNSDCDLPCLIEIAKDHVYRAPSAGRMLRSLSRYLRRKQG